MKVMVNSDQELVQEIKDKLKETNGHCPCVLPTMWSDDTICMCKNFKDQIRDGIPGECHCGLYVAVATHE